MLRYPHPLSRRLSACCARAGGRGSRSRGGPSTPGGAPSDARRQQRPEDPGRSVSPTLQPDGDAPARRSRWQQAADQGLVYAKWMMQLEEAERRERERRAQQRAEAAAGPDPAKLVAELAELAGQTAWGQLGPVEASLLQERIGQLTRQLGGPVLRSLSTAQLASLLCSLAALQRVEGRSTDSVLQVLSPRRAADLSSADMAAAMAACVQLQLYPPVHFLDAVFAAAVGTSGPAQTAGAATAAAAAAEAPAPLSLSAAAAGHQIELLHALASMGYFPAPGPLRKLIAELSNSSVLQQLGAPHHAQLLWALATLKHKPQPAQAARLQGAAIPHLCSMNAAQLMDVLWALNQLGCRPGADFSEVWFACTLKALPSCSEAQLLQALQQVTTAGLQPPSEWLAQLAAAAADRRALYSADALLQILQLLAKHAAAARQHTPGQARWEPPGQGAPSGAAKAAGSAPNSSWLMASQSALQSLTATCALHLSSWSSEALAEVMQAVLALGVQPSAAWLAAHGRAVSAASSGYQAGQQ